MSEYITAINIAETEYVEKRSRFIATLMPCETEEDALKFIDEMRSKYWDARHNCFAYVVEKGRMSRFSDDGEPHGTAGKPMLDVLVGSGMVNVAVVVTRYFGGILLGTGGLVRAYSKSVKDVAEICQKARMVTCNIYNIVCEYSDHTKLMKLLETENAMVKNTEFTDKVTVTFALKEENEISFGEKLTETFAARLKSEEKGFETVPFLI